MEFVSLLTFRESLVNGKLLLYEEEEEKLSFLLRQSLALYAKLALNSRSCYLSLLGAGVTGLYHNPHDFINDPAKQYMLSVCENFLTDQFFIEMLFLFLGNIRIII